MAKQTPAFGPFAKQLADNHLLLAAQHHVATALPTDAGSIATSALVGDGEMFIHISVRVTPDQPDLTSLIFMEAPGRMYRQVDIVGQGESVNWVNCDPALAPVLLDWLKNALLFPQIGVPYGAPGNGVVTEIIYVSLAIGPCLDVPGAETFSTRIFRFVMPEADPDLALFDISLVCRKGIFTAWADFRQRFFQFQDFGVVVPLEAVSPGIIDRMVFTYTGSSAYVEVNPLGFIQLGDYYTMVHPLDPPNSTPVNGDRLLATLGTPRSIPLSQL